MFKKSKKTIYKIIRIFGYEIRKKVVVKHHRVVHPITAFYCNHLWHENPVVFSVEVKNIINHLGFTYANSKLNWNPQVQACKEIIEGKKPISLDRFSSLEWPKYAGGCYGVTLRHSLGLKKLPYYVAPWVLPWQFISPSEAASGIDDQIRRENLQYSGFEFGVEEGFLCYGPLSMRKKEVEIRRLTNVITSIKEQGYIRSDEPDGDPTVICLERDNEFKFLVMSGFHRIAACSALGLNKIIVKSNQFQIINKNHAPYWPNVQSGLWDIRDACSYFDYLFDFDSYSWAKVNNLLDVDVD